MAPRSGARSIPPAATGPRAARARRCSDTTIARARARRPRTPRGTRRTSRVAAASRRSGRRAATGASTASRRTDARGHAGLQHPAHRSRCARAAHRAPSPQPPRAAQRHQHGDAARDPRRRRVGRGRRRGARDRRRGRRGGRSAPATTCACSAEESPRSGPVDHPLQQERRPWDPMVDYAVMKRHTEDFMALWRSQEADHREGARLRGRGRQRHRALLRPARHGRRREDRLHADARLGLPDDGDVDLSPRPGARQAADVHRRPDQRRASGRLGPREHRRSRRRARRRDRRSWRAASPACRARTWRCTSWSSTRSC